jgi:hypothetical protein
MFWFNKHAEDVLFTDIRDEIHVLCDGRNLQIKPDEIVDFRNMPYSDRSFKLVVFDSPHLNHLGSNSWMAKKYGRLTKSWREDLAKGFNECWRVLDFGGTLIFKWSETQIKLKEILSCFPQQPLFGHTTTQNLQTHWIVFFKRANENYNALT